MNASSTPAPVHTHPGHLVQCATIRRHNYNEAFSVTESILAQIDQMFFVLLALQTGCMDVCLMHHLLPTTIPTETVDLFLF